MEKLNIFKKTLTCAVSSALSLALISSYPETTGKNANNVSAQSIAEMQEQINANKGKITELQAELDALAGNKAEEQQYQNVLTKQISVIQNNITLLNQEIDSLNNDINSAQENIAGLNQSIDNQQKAIDDKIEVFKQRLCAMYISGNDNLASVVVGTSSFYDMMSRVEMVNRIATYDEELINDILGEIDSMEENKKSLESEKLTLEMKVEEQNKRKDEKSTELESLNDKMKQTQAEIDRLAKEEAIAAKQKEELEAADAEFNRKIEEVLAAEAAEAQRRYEEEQARIAAANVAAQQQAAQQGQSYTPSSPSYVPVSSSASGFAWPAPGFCYISSGYGYRWGTTHGGIDIGDSGIHGGRAVASKAGTVVKVYNSCNADYPKSGTGNCPCGGGCGNYGNHVVISHDGTYSTVYAHLASACVSVGQYVEQGQVIGYIGCTGQSTGSHLHFEVRVNGSRVDPMGYVSP